LVINDPTGEDTGFIVKVSQLAKLNL